MVKLSVGSRQKLFWLGYAFLLLLGGYGALRLLGGEIYGLILWQKLIDDPDHRWKPHEREDINSDGIRSYREATEFKPEDFNIIFSGDSYTFGHLLPAEQSTPMQFEQIAHRAFPGKTIKVANFGWSSSSPYLSLRLLRDKAEKYHPDLVIFVLDITDFKDDFFYQHVIEKAGPYKFIVEHPYLAHFPRQIARKFDGYTHWQERWLGYPDFSIYFIAHQPYEKSLPYFDRTYNNLLEMNRFVTEVLHAKFIVFVPPRHWQYTDRESPGSWEKHNYIPMGPYVLNHFVYFDQKATEASFPIISLLNDFKNTNVYPTTFEKDSHWNPDGAKLAANLIYEHCLQIQCFKQL
jgi:hypothetical protein